MEEKSLMPKKKKERIWSPPPKENRITMFQRGGFLADMKFICRGHEFHAHKLVLAASSAFMRDIFKSQEKDIPNMFTVLMRGVQPVDVQNILNYIYYGVARFRTKDRNGFYSAADLLQIDELKKGCKDSLEKVKGDVITSVNASDLCPKNVSGRKSKIDKGGAKLEGSGLISAKIEVLKCPIVGHSLKGNQTKQRRVSTLIDAANPRIPSPYPKYLTDKCYNTRRMKNLLPPENVQGLISRRYSINSSLEISVQKKPGCNTISLTLTSPSKLSKGNRSSGAVAIVEHSMKVVRKSTTNVETSNIFVETRRRSARLSLKRTEKSEKIKRDSEKNYPEAKNTNSPTKRSRSLGNANVNQGKPNPKLDESLCSKNEHSRASRKAWIRRRLQEDVNFKC